MFILKRKQFLLRSKEAEQQEPTLLAEEEEKLGQQQ